MSHDISLLIQGVNTGEMGYERNQQVEQCSMGTVFSAMIDPSYDIS